MELKLFGCCGAGETMPKYMHTSFALTVGDEVYWFEAGEGCSNTAHLMGVDLTRVSNIFISRTHMDHMGGLFNLLWFMFKLSGWTKKPLPNDGKIGLFIPEIEAWEGVLQMLVHTREGCPWDKDVIAKPINSGLLYKDKNIEITAFPIQYLSNCREKKEQSFTFRIKGEEKTVVYSGDVYSLNDLDAVLEKPCDYLLLEVEHHSIKDVCEYVNAKEVKNVICIHHGSESGYQIQQARLYAQQYSSKVFFGEDTDSITL